MFQHHRTCFLREFISRLAAPCRMKGKTTSSTKWLHRQNKDPLVKRASKDQYRCRSAYKLIELDNKFHFLSKGGIVDLRKWNILEKNIILSWLPKESPQLVDCGARPGAWSQVAAQRVGTEHMTQDELVARKGGMILAVDIDEMMDLPGVIVMSKSDLTAPEVQKRIREYILSDRKADVVMSDMAPNASGLHEMDHQRIIHLAHSAFGLSKTILKEGGVFICKLWQGGLTNSFKAELKSSFKTVRECRLKSTRKESSELFIFAERFQMSTERSS